MLYTFPVFCTTTRTGLSPGLSRSAALNGLKHLYIFIRQAQIQLWGCIFRLFHIGANIFQQQLRLFTHCHFRPDAGRFHLCAA